MTNFLQVTSFDPLVVTSNTPGPQGATGSSGPAGPTGPAGGVNSIDGAQGNVDLTQRYSPVFTPERYGAVGDGTTDDTTAVNAAIAAAQAAGGQVALATGKTYRCNGAIVFTTTGTSGAPVQKPVRITSTTGSGGWNGFWASSPLNGGAVLDLRYDGTDTLHPAKIDTRGAGLLAIDNVTLLSGGSDDFPFMQTTNTTIHLHHLAVVGNQAKTGTACAQDFLYLGGTTTAVDNTATGAFQGYGSRVHDVYFSHIRRHITWRTYANSVFVDHITTSITCGSSETHGAPFVFDAVAGSAVGNVLADCLTEVTNYPHAAACFHNAISNDFRGIMAWDASATTQSGIYFATATGNTYNRVTGGYILASKSYVDDVDGTTTFITGAQAVPSVFPQGLALRVPNNTYGLGFGAQGATTNDWLLKRLTAQEISLVPTTFASSIINMTASQIRLGDVSATSYLARAAIGGHEYLQALGSATDININMLPKGAGRMYVGATAAPNADATYDLGGNGVRWRNAWFSSYVKLGTSTTAGRPSASTAGAGATMYDTTLSKPIFSDGTVWRDAAGTAV